MIWIASAPASPEFSGYGHLYLVYDPDGNPNTGDEQIFRGGSKIVNGKPVIEIESWTPISQSSDKLNGEDPFTDRNYTLFASGSAAESTKDDVSEWASAFGVSDAYNKIVTDVPYTLPLMLGSGQPIPALNSNTTVLSAANYAGVDATSNMPYFTGDPLNGRMPTSIHAGMESYYTASDGVIAFDNNKDRIVYSLGGNNTYEITPNSLSEGTIHIYEDDDAGTLDKIVFKNIYPEDVRFERTLNGDLKIYFPWDAEGSPSVVIHGQWKDGVPAMNTVWVEPPGGGSPSIMPLNDPEDFSMLTPQSPPNWVSGITGLWADAFPLSPLVLDINSSGTIELAALNGPGSVYWDIDLDGFRETSGWITGGDGLLAIDLNNDGIINDHSELFGDQTAPGITNGFNALDIYDNNNDNYITSADTQFGDILVWIDDNADGFSQASELHTLSDLNITSIATYSNAVNYTISGHTIKYESLFTMNGQTRTIVDAWFAYDNVNTEYAADYTLDVRTLFLPDLRGYGTLPDLCIAMSENESLFEMVQALATTSKEDLFDPAFGLKDKFSEILHQWGQVDGINATSRGQYIDARDLAFLEKFVDQPFSGNPGEFAGPVLRGAYQKALYTLGGTLLAQTEGSDFFTDDLKYNALTGAFDQVSDLLDIESLQSFIQDLNHTGADLIETWLSIFGIIQAVIGLEHLSQTEKDDLSDLITTSAGPLGLSFNHLNYAFNHPLVEDSEDNILNGDFNNSMLYGYGGNDIIYSGGGQNWLNGGTGNDVYIFAVGDSDVSYGGETLNELIGEGADTIYFDNILPNDIRLYTNYMGHLYIKYSSTDLLTVSGTNNPVSGASTVSTHIEKIAFSDGTVWDLTQGLTLIDTDENHTIYGSDLADVIDGRGGTDYIYGLGGNDILSAGNEDSRLYGGDGDDILYGGGGQNYLSGGGGADVFRLQLDTAFDPIDFITDFSLAQNDALDISDLLSLYDPLTDAITDFVWISESSGNSNVFVDRDGLGSTYSLIAVATLSGVTGITDEAALVTNGNLIVA